MLHEAVQDTLATHSRWQSEFLSARADRWHQTAGTRGAGVCRRSAAVAAVGGPPGKLKSRGGWRTSNLWHTSCPRSPCSSSPTPPPPSPVSPAAALGKQQRVMTQPRSSAAAAAVEPVLRPPPAARTQVQTRPTDPTTHYAVEPEEAGSV